MARRRTTLPASTTSPVRARLDGVFDAIRAELGVPAEFPEEVLAAARAAAAQALQGDREDLSDLPFFTVDPPGSMDLDQAMLIERDGKGHRVRYAIADVPAFVLPGGPVDAEAQRRGQTVYAPDRRTPLHPPELSEAAASLLPGQVRPAYVWDLRLDADGEETSVEVRRALVRSHDRLDYAAVQAGLGADERFDLLREVGERRIRLEQERGGASLPMPEQEVVEDNGDYALRYRPTVPAEDWNAQVSLLTGMAAADLMLAGDIGILRTMPPPEPTALQRFHRQAAVLGARWPAEMTYGDFLRSLDRTNPRHMALVHAATALFRGAGYTPFVGDVPEQAEHSAVAAPYAHVTAPLRRLVDRFGLVVCEALCRGQEPPGWVTEALPMLPKVMAESDHRAAAVDRAATDAVEAAVLEPHVGQTFEAAVVEVDRDGSGGRAQLVEPAVLARVDGAVRLGDSLQVRLVEADVAARRVRFAPA